MSKKKNNKTELYLQCSNIMDGYIPLLNDLRTKDLITINNLDEHIRLHSHSIKEGVPFVKEIALKINDKILYSYAKNLESLLFGKTCEKVHMLIDIIDNSNAPKNPISLFAERIIVGDGNYIVALSKAHDLNLDELTFFGIFLVRPIREYLRQIFEKESKIEDWRMGYCPVCGLWPRMARIEPEYGRRILWCVGCDYQWPFPRMICPFCYETDQEKLGYLTVETLDGYRIYTCENCHRYLKTRDERENSISIKTSLDLDYLQTSQLDEAAIADGYIRDFVGSVAFDMIESEPSKAYKERVIKANS